MSSPASAVDGVVAGSPVDRVVAGAGDSSLGRRCRSASTPSDHRGAWPRIDTSSMSARSCRPRPGGRRWPRRRARRSRRGVAARRHVAGDVEPGAAAERVRAGAAVERVVSRAAADRVVAGAAVQHVVAFTAFEGVGGRPAVQLVGAGPTVERHRAGERCSRPPGRCRRRGRRRSARYPVQVKSWPAGRRSPWPGSGRRQRRARRGRCPGCRVQGGNVTVLARPGAAV